MTMVGRDVPRAKTDSVQLAVRIPEGWLARLDALVPWIARPGVATTRTDSIRAALARGLDALEAERAAESKKSKK